MNHLNRNTISSLSYKSMHLKPHPELHVCVKPGLTLHSHLGMLGRRQLAAILQNRRFRFHFFPWLLKRGAVLARFLRDSSCCNHGKLDQVKLVAQKKLPLFFFFFLWATSFMRCELPVFFLGGDSTPDTVVISMQMQIQPNFI